MPGEPMIAAAAPPQATRAELQQQIRSQVQAAIDQANAAAAAAGQPGAAAEGATPGDGSFRIEQGGRVITGGPGGLKVTEAQPAVAPVPPDFPFNSSPVPPEAVTISIAFFIMIAVILIGWPIARAIARRMDRAAAPAPRQSPEQAEQLRRLEQAVESVAVEVERISENQRFVTRPAHRAAARARAAVGEAGGGSGGGERRPGLTRCRPS